MPAHHRMPNSLILTLVIKAAVICELASAAVYFVINRCPSSSDQFVTHPASDAAECAFSCLVRGNCSVFATDSPLSPCAHATLGQALSLWPVSAACSSRYRGELSDSKITGYWDFRLSRDNLLTQEGYTGTFQLQGNSTTNAVDGLVVSAQTGDHALLTSIERTPFDPWAPTGINATFQASLFMRVRRRGNRTNGYFSLHSCTQPNKVAAYLWETSENRLVLVQNPNPANGTNYIQWVDQATINPDDSEWFTLGFVYSGGAIGASLWRMEKRDVYSSQNIMFSESAPIPPLCVSVGSAAGLNGAYHSMTGSIRCLLVAKTSIAVNVVNAAFLGC